jgi:adenine phosphoribosyltransferase
MGADVINMSISTEATLAKEANLEYAAIAMSTDYDCWKEDEKPVSWEGILKIFNENSEKIKKLLLKMIENLSEEKIIEEQKEFLKSKIRTIPNFPKQGIIFRDITTLIKDAEGFQKILEILEKKYSEKNIDLIAGVESRGFILASALASRLRKGIVLIRKPGKLPGEKIREEYDLEYGRDSLEIHKDSISPGQKILLIDDLIATGGTVNAAANLIQNLGGEIVEVAFVIELADLKGREKLEQKGHKVFSILSYEGE